MNCDKCNAVISAQDVREHNGRMLCEDCYMDALSPAKACDPWAVYCATSSARQAGAAGLTETQQRLLQILEETGGIEPHLLMARLGLRETDFDRELATLRHMEKLRAEMRGGVKVICLW